MKKLLALLTAVLCLFAACAMAEPAEVPAIEVPEMENGAWLQFEDYNIQICMPGDWNVGEVTEEQAESGVFFMAFDDAQAHIVTLAYTEFEEATDMETILTELSAAYENCQMIIINDMPFVTYTIAESDVNGLVTLGGAGIGLYQFVFYPASDADFETLAVQIASSICTIE